MLALRDVTKSQLNYLHVFNTTSATIVGEDTVCLVSKNVVYNIEYDWVTLNMIISPNMIFIFIQTIHQRKEGEFVLRYSSY